MGSLCPSFSTVKCNTMLFFFFEVFLSLPSSFLPSLLSFKVVSARTCWVAVSQAVLECLRLERSFTGPQSCGQSIVARQGHIQALWFLVGGSFITI